MGAVADLIAQGAQRDLRRVRLALEATTQSVEIRRLEKSLALYTSKVFCPHANIVQGHFYEHGRQRFAYACADCKTRVVSHTYL